MKKSVKANDFGRFEDELESAEQDTRSHSALDLSEINIGGQERTPGHKQNSQS